jgi:hypothetical protein
MKRKRRKLVAIICALTLALSSAVPVSACTPPLKPPSVKIPDINFEPNDALKEAISNAVKNWIEKCILGTPTVEYASYYKSASRYFNYSHVAVKWTKVENATSYRIKVTKADGSYKEFDTTYTSFYAMNYTDEFFDDGMDDATVMVRAYGENGTFSLWSKTTTITRFRY